MSKIVVFFLCGLFLQLSLRAQEREDVHSLDPADVPAVVMQNFTRQHPGVHGTWTHLADRDQYRVEYIDRDSRLRHAIVYDKDGNVIRKEDELKSVPAPINEYYNQNYPGEQIRTWSTEDAKGQRSYYGSRGAEDLRFDHEGKLIMSGNKPFSPVKGEKNKTE